MDRIYLDLTLKNEKKLYLKPDKYKQLNKELKIFLETEDRMNTKEFAQKVMFSHEIKSNNNVEGYLDDIEVVKSIIKKNIQVKDIRQKNRILNLYLGYKYILDNKDINEITLKELYSLLSDGLLKNDDKIKMGIYYRNAPVYILQQGRLDQELDQGVEYKDIKKYMDKYFEFLNNYKETEAIDYYIKSQILHYYFVYIHPYFDVNGRTSRTLSMWYLLNKECYPNIIFNRGISFKDNDYDKIISNVKNTNDLTIFISYMLETLIRELEKENILEQIASNSTTKLDSIDYQALLYFLTLKGEKSILDFATIYNRFNDKKTVKEIYENIIIPLLDKGILDTIRETKHNMYNNQKNKILVLRNNLYTKDKIKRIEL